MAYEMVMPYHLHMPSYFLETFTEYPFVALYWEISSGKILLEDYRIRPNASNTPNSSILREVSPNMLFNSFPLLIFTILCHAMK